jgi:hypothetical protein
MENEFIILSKLINERLFEGSYMSEDNIRYSLYSALIQRGNVFHTEISLEYPHPSIKRAQIDTYINGDSYPHGVAIEFKYDRSNPGGTNQNRTQRAGAFLADIFRLSLVPNTLAKTKYFVYLTDGEMHSYFCNPNNSLNKLYQLPNNVGFSLDDTLLSKLAKSATSRIGNLLNPCMAKGYYKNSLERNHELRVYSIRSAS